MDWRLVFEQSKVNGGVYLGEELPERIFRPTGDSWFQKRLEFVRRQLKSEMIAEKNAKPSDA